MTAPERSQSLTWQERYDAAPTWQERYDTAPRPESMARGEKIGLAGFVLFLLMVCVGVALLVDRWMNDPWSRWNWDARADTVAAALNDRYVEDIQVHRETGHSGGRGSSRRIEVIVVDGRIRDDCAVKDDRHPVLVCDGPAPHEQH